MKTCTMLFFISDIIFHSSVSSVYKVISKNLVDRNYSYEINNILSLVNSLLPCVLIDVFFQV